MDDIISYLTSAFTLAFVVSSMFGLGLGLTVQQIVEPLKNVRLVLMALLANFVIVPAVAFTLTRLLPLDQDLQIGLLLLATVAGAPVALKAAQIARGDVILAVSLVTLLVVATVIYLPLVLPLLIPGVEVNMVAIALPLLLQVVAPLGLGLVMNVRYDEEAEMARPLMAEIANISLVLLIVVNLTNIGDVLSLLGTGAILAILVVIAVGLGAGYLLGGPGVPERRTLSLVTGQRGYASAFVIADGNFADRETVFLLLLTATLISMIVVLVLAGEFLRRAKAAGQRGAETPGDSALVEGDQTAQP